MKSLEMSVWENKRSRTGVTFKGVAIFLAVSFVNIVFTSGKHCHSRTIKINKPPFVTNTPSINHLFVGRQEHLTKLREKLKTQKTLGIICVVGMAGMGKTQLAKQYAHTYTNDYDVVWWMDANQDLLPQIRELGHGLASFNGYPMPNINEKRQEKWLEAVKDCCDQYGFKVLLIIDDVKDKATIKEITRILQNFHIVLTSRNQSIGDHRMLLNCFTREESVGYLGNCLPGTASPSLNTLADTLSDYPLALAQAVTYINLFPSISIADYISLYRDKRKSLWKEEESVLNKNTEANPLREYQRTVAATFTLLLEQVKEASPHAFALLQFTSFLGSQDIPQTLLKDWLINHRKVSDFDFHHGLSTLIKLSIFEKKENGESLFNIHELLQEFIRESLTKEEKEQYLEEVAHLISSYLPAGSYQMWKVLFKDSNLEYHLESLLKFAELSCLQSNKLLELKIKYLNFLYFFKADYQTPAKKIEALEKEVKENRQISPLEKARFLMLSGNVATISSSYDDAIAISEEAEKILAPIQTPEARDERFFLLVNNLMDFYNVKGMLKKAAEAGQEAELLLPHINNVTFLSLYYFMRSFQLFTIGEYEAALKHVNISVEKYASTDFPEHFHLFNKIFKAEILARSGELTKGLELIEANRVNFQKFYPNESNFKILRMDAVRAFIYLKQGKLKESMDLITSTIDGFNSLFKKNNENAIQGFSLIVLGELYENQNDFLYALEAYKKAEKIYNHIFSERDAADVSYLYKNMAILGEKLKDDFITQTYFQLLLKHFGRKHIRTQEVIDYLEARNLQVPWSKL